MFCPQCGSGIPDGARFCPNCGAPLQPSAPEKEPEWYAQQESQQQGQYQQPYEQQFYRQQDQPRNGTVAFLEAIKLFFLNYADFNGRATPGEFWWAQLFLVLACTAAGILDGVIGSGFFSGILSLGTVVPSLAIAIRRLHDIGKAWTWYLMVLIPLAGPIILIVYFCRPSVGDNQWGPGPAQTWR